MREEQHLKKEVSRDAVHKRIDKIEFLNNGVSFTCIVADIEHTLHKNFIMQGETPSNIFSYNELIFFYIILHKSRKKKEKKTIENEYIQLKL